MRNSGLLVPSWTRGPRSLLRGGVRGVAPLGADGGLGDADGGLVHVGLGLGLVQVHLGGQALGDELVVAIQVVLGEVGVGAGLEDGGLGLGQLGAGLGDLLVEVGGVDLGELGALLHLVAQVD